MTETIRTKRYRFEVEEIDGGGPAGYESVYLAAVADPASLELITELEKLDGRLLPALERRRQLAQKDDSQPALDVRNGARLEEALREGWPIGIASGFKPSGPFHFGHKMVSRALAYFQRNGLQLFVPVADVEAAIAQLPKAMPEEQYMLWAADNLLDWGAHGVNLDAAHVYRQSEEFRVSSIAYRAARSLSFELAADTYGFQTLIETFPFLFAGMTQVGDILLAQHEDFGNRHSFMVSGPDQDGHMKMTEALSRDFLEAEGMGGANLKGISNVPSAFYVPHIRGLTGGKASSSQPESTLYLGSGPDREGLEERIESSLAKFDRHLAEGPEAVETCTRDMATYIDFFHDHLPSSGKPNYTEVVRDSLADALRLEQARRKAVLDYAVGRAEQGDGGLWDQADRVTPPDFWKVPDEAVVDPSLRCKSDWYHMVAAMADRLVP